MPIPRLCPRAWPRAAQLLIAGLGLLAAAGAQAVPSFARQTGMACVACHVGGFGPQLTDFGVQFKLGGYTMAKPDAPLLPLSGMVMVSGTHTSTDLPEPLPDHVRANNNLKMDQASLFVAGRLAEYLGVFSQITYDGIGRSTALDETEFRLARQFEWGEHAVLAGLSVNNDPANSDPFNALPSWSFPFIASAIAPAPDAATLFEGALAGYVVGPTLYAMVDNQWYGALGTYQTLSTSGQKLMGLDPAGSPGILHGAVYGRLAAKQAWGAHSLAGGLMLFSAGVQPDRNVGLSNHFRDLGVDATYRWQTDNNHVLSVMGSLIHETQRRDADSAAGAASNNRGSLQSLNLTANYYLDQTWGFNVQRFAVSGSGDSLRYGDGFANGSPNSAGTRLQLDWTPWGKTPVASAWNPNLRLGLQYTAYSRFNGAHSNYDGSGRNASDNNSLYLFGWLMF